MSNLKNILIKDFTFSRLDESLSFYTESALNVYGDDYVGPITSLNRRYGNTISQFWVRLDQKSKNGLNDVKLKVYLTDSENIYDAASTELNNTQDFISEVILYSSAKNKEKNRIYFSTSDTFYFEEEYSIVLKKNPSKNQLIQVSLFEDTEENSLSLMILCSNDFEMHLS